MAELSGAPDINYKPFKGLRLRGVPSMPRKPTLVKGSIILSLGSTSVDLPAPNFQDREEMLLTRIQRKTRGGTLKTFSDRIWPSVRTFRYKFDNLQLSKIEEFHSFLDTTLGLQVHLVDHEGREWDGYIVNPQGEATNFARTCGSTTEFDFDGVEA